MSIYNLLGQKVATLVSEKKLASTYKAEWDASGFSNGVYYYRMTSNNFTDIKKMILLK